MKKTFLRPLLATVAAALIFSCQQPAPGADEKSKDTGTTVQEDTAITDQTVSPDEKNVIRLLAEKGKAKGPAIKYMPEWKAFGWFTAKDTIVWDVNVLKAGNYTVQMEWSVDDAEAGKSYVLTAGGASLKGVVGKSGSWETYVLKPIGRIELKAGRQEIVFRPDADFSKGALLDLRELQLTPENE
ncbi:hypothetical protein [Chitinophaga defluvii]|uniref:Carbohydrate binding protein with CBM6 domain n=1 Tax=Chitinophaga defluvii TaxID=3163343 RepID=A0ABV2T625_9BACT